MKIFGKKTGLSGGSDARKGIEKVARPEAFTIRVDPQKFNLATKPQGPVHESLKH